VKEGDRLPLPSAKEMKKKPGDQSYLLNMNKKILDTIDKIRAKSFDTRKSWIVKAILEKLEKLGYNIDDFFE
jgi:Leu/Phe-tRNA-protein transferase